MTDTGRPDPSVPRDPDDVAQDTGFPSLVAKKSGPSGCACSSGGAAGAWWLGLVGVLAFRRRR